MAGPTARFVVHGELADLLSADKRGRLLLRPVDGTSTVKHAVESLGVPHTEYGELRINGFPVTECYQLQDRDVVDVYPAQPVSTFGVQPRFLLDSHLGTLARYLRLLGFDVAYDNTADDDELLARAAADARTLQVYWRGSHHARISQLFAARPRHRVGPGQLIDRHEPTHGVDGRTRSRLRVCGQIKEHGGLAMRFPRFHRAMARRQDGPRRDHHPGTGRPVPHSTASTRGHLRAPGAPIAPDPCRPGRRQAPPTGRAPAL